MKNVSIKASEHNAQRSNNTLVLGGTGKTGRRIVTRLKELGVPVRVGMRAGEPCFEWHDQSTWEPALRSMSYVYIAFYPDLAMPGTVDIIRAFTATAVQCGVRRLVLLSGRGEIEAQACEQVVQQAGIEWTILRVSWFCQNFSEGFMRELILSGLVSLPTGGVKEPFIDVDDIADAAVLALTEKGHINKVYEMTGPELLSMAEAVGIIAKVSGRDVEYVQISPEDFVIGLSGAGVPEPLVSMYHYLFTTVLDGRNSCLSDGVQAILGREPRGFAEFARDATAAGAW